MGGANSTVKDVVELDTYMKDSATTQALIGKAFNKCIIPPEGSSHEFNNAELNEEQRRCVLEYVSLYSHYARGGYKKFMDLYNQHQQQMMEREMQQQQGRE